MRMRPIAAESVGACGAMRRAGDRRVGANHRGHGGVEPLDRRVERKRHAARAQDRVQPIDELAHAAARRDQGSAPGTATRPENRRRRQDVRRRRVDALQRGRDEPPRARQDRPRDDPTRRRSRPRAVDDRDAPTRTAGARRRADGLDGRQRPAARTAVAKDESAPALGERRARLDAGRGKQRGGALARRESARRRLDETFPQLMRLQQAAGPRRGFDHVDARAALAEVPRRGEARQAGANDADMAHTALIGG